MSISFSIPLTKGRIAFVDVSDYVEVSKFKWTLKQTKYKEYAYRQYLKDGKMVQILLHMFVSQCPEGMKVDHANGDGLDNRIKNLRICTQSFNLANITAHKDRKYDLPKGVSYRKNRIANPYSARVNKDGVTYNLGSFKTPEEAAEAYKTKAKDLFGEFFRC